MSSNPSHGLDMSQLINMAASMGISQDTVRSILSDPSAMQRLMGQMGDTPPKGGSGSNARDEGLETFQKMLADLPRIKERNAVERSLPPTKIPLMHRELVLESIRQARLSQEENAGMTMVKQTIIGNLPAFSNVPVEQLKKVLLADLYVRKVHKGLYLLCRIITPTASIVAVNFVVEDPAGNAINLTLYNYPCTLGANLHTTDSIFPIGSILAVREPYLKIATHGRTQSLRVDSPSDLVFIDQSHEALKDVKWTTGGNVAGAPVFPKSADGWKERGATEFKAKRWFCAAISFTEALKLDPTHVLSLLNRAETYLRLEWFNSALNDSEAVLKSELKDDNLLRKAIVRAVKASYYLGRYEHTIELIDIRPNDPELVPWTEKAQRRLREGSTGEYDWCSLFRQSQGPAARLEAAEFTGPVEVRNPELRNGIRGTYATRDIDIGELLMVAKPMACVYPEDNPNSEKEIFFAFNFLTDSIKRYSQAALITKVVQNMWDNPDISQKLDFMYAGPLLAPPVDLSSNQIPSAPLRHALKSASDINIARIESIVSFNSFRLHHLETSSQSQDEIDDSGAKDTPVALYFLPSLCNHSCLPSARYFFFGDIMVIRARNHIRKGEEITLEYWSGVQSLITRNKRKQWGFDCSCLLCAADRIDGEKASELRSRLARDLDPDSMMVAQANALIAKVSATYKDSPERKRCGTKPDLALAYHGLGATYTAKFMQNPSQVKPESFKQRIGAEMNFLSALGMVITDRSMSGPSRKKNSKTLPIDTRRGPTHLSSFCTFSALEIAKSFKTLRDGRRARDWIKVALWLEDIAVGGGKELFLLRFNANLSEWDMKELVIAALSS